MPVIKSISDLRAELAAKEQQVAKLQSRRAAVGKELDRIDRQIAVLAGKAPKVFAVRKAVKAPKAVKVPRPAKAAGGRAAKRATGKPLTAYIKDALKSAKGGLRVTEVVAAVKAAGYMSYSKDFYAIVAKTLLTDDSFKRVKRGVYTLS